MLGNEPYTAPFQKVLSDAYILKCFSRSSFSISGFNLFILHLLFCFMYVHVCLSTWKHEHMNTVAH